MNTLDLSYLRQLCRYTPIEPCPGVWPSYTRRSYDSIPAISSTVLKQWMRDERIPSRFEYWLANRWDEAQSSALVIGDALDCRVLTPKEFPARFATVPPDAPKRPSKMQQQAKKPSPETLQAIGYWNKFNAENGDKVILNSEQMDAVNGMSKSVLSAVSTAGVFENCAKAVLIGEILEIPAKAEIDLWSENSEHIIDLKSAADASPGGFGVAAARYGYIEQAIWYLTLAQNLGFEKRIFSWIVVESVPPFALQCYSFDPDSISTHRVLYQQIFDKMMASLSSLATALEIGKFTNPADWQPLSVPGWALERTE